MAGSTGLEPATSGLTERNTVEPAPRGSAVTRSLFRRIPPRPSRDALGSSRGMGGYLEGRGHGGGHSGNALHRAQCAAATVPVALIVMTCKGDVVVLKLLPVVNFALWPEARGPRSSSNSPSAAASGIR